MASFEENLIQFSSSFYGVLDNTQSICVSPYSVTAAFMIVMIGANRNSKKQISSALFKDSNLSEIDKLMEYRRINRELIFRAGKANILATANRLYVNRNYRLQNRIRKLVRRYFGAGIRRMNFTPSQQAARVINRWVSGRTRHKIKDLVEAGWLRKDTVLVLVNAIYFRGLWETEFDPKNTMVEDFYVSKGKTIKVNMMKMNKTVPHVLTRSYSAISLPYKGNKFAMVFILPDQSIGLSRLEARIKTMPGFFSALASSFEDEQLKIYIPKFRIRSKINLRKELPKLQVKDIFDPSKADFSRLVKDATGGIYVSRAVHQVYIDVDEKGTEGTAATAAVFSKGGDEFRADRPFLFYIRDIKSGVMLFIGRYKPVK